MSKDAPVDRDREPALLLVGRRRSGKTHTRMRWSQEVRMCPIAGDGVQEPRIETGRAPGPTIEVTEHRAHAGGHRVRVIDMPGEIVDSQSEQAGRYGERLEQIAGRVGGVVLCVAPPAPPPGEAAPRSGYIHPNLLPLCCEELQPGEGRPEPAVAHLAEARARIDTAMAFCEQLLGRLGIAAAGLPIAVQLGFADLCALARSDEEDERVREWLHAQHAGLWPDRAAWTDPARIEERLLRYRDIDERVSRIFGDIVVWMRRRYPGYRLWFYAASNLDDPVGHRSAAMGFAYLVDQTLGREVVDAELARQEQARRERRAAARARALRWLRPLAGIGAVAAGLVAASSLRCGGAGDVRTGPEPAATIQVPGSPRASGARSAR